MLLALGLSCAGDGTGPAGVLAGRWDFSTNLTGASSIACSTPSTSIHLQPEDTTFTGTYTGTLNCEQAGNPLFSVPVSGLVVHGLYNPATGAVSFDFDDQSISHTGILSTPSLMSGTADWFFDVGPPTGVIVLSGAWGATR